MLDENRPPLASRRDLIIVQTEAEPEPRWTVKDPLSLKYFHLRAEERFVLQQLDGTTSYEQILANFAREFSPLQLRSEELLSFIERLWRQGLLMDHRALPAELWVAKRRAAATTAGLRRTGTPPRTASAR